MSKKFHLQFLVGCICFGLGASGLAQTNAISPPGATNATTQNALLQIQDQLHDAQLAIADTRAKDEADAATNTAILTARILSLEQAVASQRDSEADAARRTQQMTMILAVAFALIGFGAFLLVFYFQWRAFSQFSEITARQLALQSASPSLVGAAGELAAGLSGPARATVETSNTRLLTLVERLEKKVVEMEQSARGQLPAAAPVAAEQNGRETLEDRPLELEQKTHNGHNGHDGQGIQNGHGEQDEASVRVASLLADGQTLLNAEQPENALKLFEEALILDGHNADALIKKAGALERMHRIDEAITCYNRAIELDNTATMAWLQKGGLYNRLARYDEAMQCYEKALQAQGTPG
ncbi:MAG TPA: tetratricopeptide repeat protein [Verrucomicrobiae bacterium]|jgi:tetratricopeptide (TPR) repeat protein